ncbi:bacteriohemerythrin [Novispirillum sp. DQ9]|uniref:bacteriohemerythrin n=1 Tax=Novispirillum sp. DQ9 TaxID=3398612 RepID=UPI003C797394
MTLITWQDSYSVGVDLIDSDHKLLVSLINQLGDAADGGQGRDVVGSVLNVLIEYTEGHFSREERLMEKGGYPDLPAHREHHRALTNKVREMVGQYRDGRIDALDSDILEFLRSWLTGHILGVDMEYRPYVKDVTLTPEELLASLNLDGDDEDDGPTL